MRETIHHASQLLRLWDAAAAAWPDPSPLFALGGEFGQRLWLLVRYIFENAAVLAAAEQSCKPPEAVALEPDDFLGRVHATLEKAGDTIERYLEARGSSEWSEELDWAQSWSDRVPRRAGTLDELRRVARFLNAATRSLSDHRSGEGLSLGEANRRKLTDACRELSKDIGRAEGEWQFASTFRQDWQANPVALARELYDAYSGLAQAYPFHDDHAMYSVTRGLRGVMERLVSDTCAELEKGALPALAIQRLVAYFEHFDHGQTRAEAVQHSSRAEQIVQRAVDRFLFQEGLFPITHCEASGGNVDTFVEEHAAPLFDESVSRHLPAILIELKQLLGKDPTTHALSKVAEDARQQAEQYRRTLQARRPRGELQTWALIMYAGPTRYIPKPSWASDAAAGLPHIELVYVGDASPSAKPKPLPAA